MHIIMFTRKSYVKESRNLNPYLLNRCGFHLDQIVFQDQFQLYSLLLFTIPPLQVPLRIMICMNIFNLMLTHFFVNTPKLLLWLPVILIPPSTGLKENRVKSLSGLRQIIDVPTREKYILDWCLVNLKDVSFQSTQWTFPLITKILI